MQSTANYSDKLEALRTWIREADAIIIGAGAGLSAAAGLDYGGRRFVDNFADYIQRYGFADMYTAGFYPFASPEEKWAYWSRHIYLNRYAFTENGVYAALLSLVKDKAYFIITTNVDALFEKTGFAKDRIFAVQGDYGKWQCARPCHDVLYDNEAQVREMVTQQYGCRIPPELVPRCPVCGGPMENNLRSDERFIEDRYWHEASNKYEEFLFNHQNKKIIFLELGVGFNTPGIIRFPFESLTSRMPDAKLVRLNAKNAAVPKEIEYAAVSIERDIAEIMNAL